MRLPTLAHAALIALLVGASACATAPLSENDYAAEVAALNADCRAKDGLLRQTGLDSGEPGRDHVCELRTPRSDRLQ